MSNYFGKLDSWDASATDGLVCKGYSGLVSDGEYVYFSPYFDGSAYHGRVLRMKIYAVFKDAGSWEAFDAGTIDGLTCKGFYGNPIFDGQFVYFVPFYDGTNYHGKVLRYDTTKPFKSASSWEAFDASSTGGLTCKGYIGGGFDGQFVYFSPNYNGTAYHGVALRYDTTKPFKDSSSWTAFDAGSIGGLVTKGFYGAIIDEDFVYFSPYTTSYPNAVRYNRNLPFTAASAWSAFNVSSVHADCKGFGEPAADEEFLYFPPIQKNLVLRYRKALPFSVASSWEYFNLENFQSWPEAHDSCFFFDHYVVFCPSDYSVLMYDRDLPFSDILSWTIKDIGELGFWGYKGALADPNYFFFAPLVKWADIYHGTVARLRVKPCPNQSAPDPGGVQHPNVYSKDDMSGQTISTTSTRATASQLEDGQYAICYQDYGAGAFNALEINFDIRLTSAVDLGDPDYVELYSGILGFSNKHSEYDPGIDDPLVGFNVEFDNGSRLNQYINLNEAQYYAISMNTTYYCKLLRAASGGTLTLKIYSDAARTTLLATKTASVSTSRSWRYIYAIRSSESSTADGYMSFWVENINVIQH